MYVIEYYCNGLGHTHSIHINLFFIESIGMPVKTDNNMTYSVVTMCSGATYAVVGDAKELRRRVQ